MNINDYIISENNTIIETLEVIDRNAKGIAYVCDGKILRAAVTDGNVRRYILKNGNINDKISAVANYEPKYVMWDDEIDHVEYMKANQVTSIPILNSKHEIITIKFLNADPIYASVTLRSPVVIMAGGKGTRLEPLTQVLPKPLIPIKNQTISEMIMEKFKAFGCREFDMIVNYKKDLIKAFFMDSEKGYQINFVEEPEYLGTGGGLKLLKGKYAEPFFMTNCDILLDEDYGRILKLHREENRILTMVCALKEFTVPYGTIEVGENGLVKSLEEKPKIAHKINTGFYVIDPRFLDYIPDNTFIHITDVIERCIEAGERVGVYPVSAGSWWDMGQFDELKRMQKNL